MSDLLSLLDRMEEPRHSVYRELYFKRQFLSGGSLDYETEWATISSERVKSWGVISTKSENINNVQDRMPSNQIVLSNIDGYFSDVDVTASVFNGAYARQRTLVKIDVGYYDSQRNKLPENDTAFVGIIDGQISENSEGEITFELTGFEDVFRSTDMSDIAGFVADTTTSDISNWNVIRAIQEHTDGAGNYVFQPYFPLDDWIIEVSSRQFQKNILDTASVDDLSCWEYMQKMAQVCDMRFLITRQGKVFFGQDDIDDYIAEETGSAADTNCIFHATFNDTLAATISGTTAVTCTSATPAYNTGYHGNGFLSDLSGTSFCQVGINTFNPQRFCIEFWYAPENFGISGGAAAESAAMMEISIAAFQGYALTDDDEIKIGFGTYHGNSAGAGAILGIGKQMGISGAVAFCECSAAADIDVTAGSVGFFAFVHDAYGIGGSRDVFRIYHGTGTADEPSLVASVTLGATENNTGDACACILGDNNQNYRTFNLLPLSAGSATGTAVIDNLKIYDYAKTNFTDYKTESEYFKKKKYFVQGPGGDPGSKRCNVIGGITVDDGVEDIYNRIEITHSDASSIQEETYSRGDSSSSDMYGVHEYKTTINFINTAAAESIASELFTRFKDPLTRVNAPVKLFPYLNLFDKLQVTFRSVVQSNGQRQLDINDQTYKIIGYDHDLDSFETSLELRKEP